MEREKIELSEFDIAPILCEWVVENEEYEEFFDEDENIIGEPIWNNFEIIKEKVTYYDLEKGYEQKSTIVRRESDGKYFKGTWKSSPYVGNSYDTTLIEVFPKQKTKTVYE